MVTLEIKDIKQNNNNNKNLHSEINKLPNLHFQILELLFILRERTFKT